MAKVTLTDEQIDALRAEHGEVAAADTIMGTAVFRAPTADEYRKAMQMRTHPTQGPHAGPWIAAECVVAPDKATWLQWVKARAGIARSVSVDNAIHRLIGLDADAIFVDTDAGTTVTTCAGDVTLKPADDRQLREYEKKLDADKLEAFEYLSLACVVAPARDELAKWIAEKPGISATLIPHIRRITGLEADERLKG